MDTRQEENLVGFDQLPEQGGAAHVKPLLCRVRRGAPRADSHVRRA